MEYVYGKDYRNELPASVLAEDRLSFGIEGGSQPQSERTLAIQPEDFPMWQRWNDYGIGLLLKGNAGSDKGELKQAAAAFSEVEALGRPEGPINLARVYFKEGRVDDAAQALQRAAAFDPQPPRWSMAWFTGQVHAPKRRIGSSHHQLSEYSEDRYRELEDRDFDFSKDYVVINELGQTYYLRSKLERGRPEAENNFWTWRSNNFRKRSSWILKTRQLTTTSPLSTASWARKIWPNITGKPMRSIALMTMPDRAVAVARARDPAARHASQSIVIYDLQREAD